MEHLDYDLLKQMRVTIGEAATITNIPIRKLRYWESIGIIKSADEGHNKTRKFDYYQVKKIILIKELLDEGYTLEKANEKVDNRIKALEAAFNKMTL